MIDLNQLLADEKCIQKPSKKNIKDVLQKYLNSYPESRIGFLYGSDENSENYINFLFHNRTNNEEDRPAIRGSKWAEYLFHMFRMIDNYCSTIAQHYELSKQNSKIDPNETLTRHINILREALPIMKIYTGLSQYADYTSEEGIIFDVDNMQRTWEEIISELEDVNKLGHKRRNQKALIRANAPLILSTGIFKVFEYRVEEEKANCIESIINLFSKYKVDYDTKPLKIFITLAIKTFYSNFLHTNLDK